MTATVRLTQQMQDILDCHLTEIGVAIRNAEMLEAHLNIVTVRDALQTPRHKLKDVRNFGEKGREELFACLERYGFCEGNTYEESVYRD